MHVCDLCNDEDCINCYNGNPCLSCTDYDRINNECMSNGACSEVSNQLDKRSNMTSKDEKAMDVSEKIIDMVSQMEEELLLAFLYAITNEMVDRHIFENKKVGD